MRWRLSKLVSQSLPERLGAQLSQRDAHEVTVTDHGKAVARLVPLGRSGAIDRLIGEGLISPPAQPKRLRTAPRVSGRGTVSDLVAEQRR